MHHAPLANLSLSQQYVNRLVRKRFRTKAIATYFSDTFLSDGTLERFTETTRHIGIPHLTSLLASGGHDLS